MRINYIGEEINHTARVGAPGAQAVLFSRLPSNTFQMFGFFLEA